VDDRDTVTSFFDFSEPLEKDNTWKNVLLPKNTSTAYPGADNKFPFTSSGMNFKSKNLKTYFGCSYNTFGLYNSTPGKMDYKLWVTDDYVTTQKYQVLVTSVLVPPCFKKGTKVLSLNRDRKEEYVPVENLVRGDMLKTYLHGFRPIESISKLYMVNKPDMPRTSMYKIKKSEDEDSLVFKDLTLIGEHSILVDKLSPKSEKDETSCYNEIYDIDGKYCHHCCLHPDFEQVRETRFFECYHILLNDDGDFDKGFGIWANGLLVETPCFNEFIEDKYSHIIEDHVKFIHSKSPLASQAVFWDREKNRWDVEGYTPQAMVELQERATESMALAKIEAEAAIKAKTEAEALIEAKLQAEEFIEKSKKEMEEAVKMKEEAKIEMEKAMKEAEESKRALIETEIAMEKSKKDAEEVIKAMNDAEAGDILLQAKAEAEETRKMKEIVFKNLEISKEKMEVLEMRAQETESKIKIAETKKDEVFFETEQHRKDLSTIKLEVQAAIETKMENEEKLKNIQEEIDFLITSKSGIEETVIDIKAKAEKAMEKANADTKGLLDEKEKLVKEIQNMKDELVELEKTQNEQKEKILNFEYESKKKSEEEDAKKNAERKEAERKEAERKEAERKAAKAKAKAKEAERIEAERKEAEKKEAERKEAERKAAKAKAKAKEAERIEAERKEAKKKAKEQEAVKKKEEEEAAKKKAEEEAAKKKVEEEAAKKKEEEEATKKKVEEEAVKKKAEEEAAKKKAEEEVAKKKAEEEAAKKKAEEEAVPEPPKERKIPEKQRDSENERLKKQAEVMLKAKKQAEAQAAKKMDIEFHK
jgi:hypothetical protein